MSFCLIPKLADQFIAKIRSGEIDPAKLSEMTSEERRSFFSFLGEENAKRTNALFESKLILKNQELGIVNWAKQVTGIKPEVLRDILTKASRMTEVLQPKELDKFLADLAEQRLGFGVTAEEAGKIAELAKKVSDAKEAMAKGGDRLDYGRAKVEFGNYVSDLKNQSKKLTIKERLKPGNQKQNLLDVAGATKAIKASMDDSAIFRQGWKTVFTNPQLWTKNALKSFSDIVRTFGGKEVMNEVNADILSRPNYDLMRKAKLDVAATEEAFPTAMPEKIPIFGRAYKASEVAYTAFLHRMRADVFDKYIEIAKKTNVTLDDVQLKSIGKLVNSLTGRGYLGSLEPGAQVINNVFFSPRKLKADFDFLTAHSLQKDTTPFVRKQAAINLAKVVAGTAAILTIADTIAPGSVEKDPRSSDFGKIRIKDTRFDVTGGMASILILAARELTQSSKSSTTGKVTKLNSGKYGAQTGWDVATNFVQGKLSPAVAIVKDLVNGQDFSGNKITLKGELKNAFEPLPATTYEELKNNPNSANILVSMLADALGISVNTYSPKPKKK